MPGARGTAAWPHGEKADRAGVVARVSRARSSSYAAESNEGKAAPALAGAAPITRPESPLLDGDGDLHAQRLMLRAVALVRPLGGIGERHVVGLVGLREEGSGEIIHGVLHIGVWRRGAARRNRFLPERDVVEPARHDDDPDGG